MFARFIIQHYVTVRFEQFISIVDRLEGVEVRLSEAESAYINRVVPDQLLSAEPGLKVLNGRQLLAHSCNRSVGQGDFDRTRRQRESMLAIFEKTLRLRDPITLSRLISFTLDQVHTNISPNRIFTLAMEVVRARNLNLQTARVPYL